MGPGDVLAAAGGCVGVRPKLVLLSSTRLFRLRAEYVFHVFQMTSEKSVLCPKYVEYGGIRMEYMNTYSKRGPKMDVFRIKFSPLREFST